MYKAYIIQEVWY